MSEMTPEHAAPIRLLWTGGWDSTFQLLVHVLVDRAPVEPIYLVDTRRQSRSIEIRAMDRIRARMVELDPDARTRLRPTWYAPVESVRPDDAVTAAFDRLVRTHRIGAQYDWLARFCVEHELDDVVMGFENGRHGAHGVLRDAVGEGAWQRGAVHRVRRDALQSDVGVVFGRYVFPLFERTKRDMAAEVDRRGWRPIMLETWFCHRPVGTEPCARCHPCVQAIHAGLGWRIPPHRRAIGLLQRATIDTGKRMARPVVHAMRDAVTAYHRPH
jgi:hypothetical protein